jgi:predicted pyridoxine 5'-phosphate oxidase superfamily flavin-nucleotide-binding protein
VSGELEPGPLTLASIERCFGGAVPAVIVTADADGLPNVTYLSRAHAVDGERIALSNQFFSKTARNLADNPRASLMLVDPVTYDEYRLSLVYERTERRGRVFERLRNDVDAIASLTGMQDVFRLRAADIYRVIDLEQVASNALAACPAAVASDAPSTVNLAELCARLTRCPDLDALVGAAVEGIDRLLGYEHIQLLLLDEDGRRLYTIASRGFDSEGVGAEVAMGDGVIGLAAAQGVPVRVGNLAQMAKYSRSIRRSFEDQGGVGPGREIRMPGLPGAQSRVAVPAMALGQLVGVLVADSAEPVAFGTDDEAVLSVVASLFANAVETIRAEERTVAPDRIGLATATATPRPASTTHVRFFAVDGSTFLDGDYLIKGVAGRILWSLLNEYDADGRVEFTNKELRLDPSLDMPGFKDNLESRLILLKRRLDERGAPIRIDKTGRGRFRIDLETSLRLEAIDQ